MGVTWVNAATPPVHHACVVRRERSCRVHATVSRSRSTLFRDGHRCNVSFHRAQMRAAPGVNRRGAEIRRSCRRERGMHDWSSERGSSRRTSEHTRVSRDDGRIPPGPATFRPVAMMQPGHRNGCWRLNAPTAVSRLRWRVSEPLSSRHLDQSVESVRSFRRSFHTRTLEERPTARRLVHGAYRDRTDDLLVANQALSQLS